MLGQALPFEISEKAKNEVLSIVKEKNIPTDYGLRVGIKGGGCSGISYQFGFDKKQTGDVEYTLEKLPVFIEKKHFMYITGLEIDFIDDAFQRGFTFNNPNTKF